MKKILNGLALVLTTLCTSCAPKSPASQIQSVGETSIIGGDRATGDESYSKTIVAILDTANGGICTGSILSKSTILTAAHCITAPAKSLKLKFGVNLFDKTNSSIRSVESFKLHPGWVGSQSQVWSNRGDLALLKFSGGLPKGYRPVEILNNPRAIQDGASVQLAGYGVIDSGTKSGWGYLRHVQTKIMKSAYSPSELLIDQRNWRGICFGDSGGPTYMRERGRWLLVGVTSAVIHNNRGAQRECAYLGLITKVGPHAGWISRTAWQ